MDGFRGEALGHEGPKDNENQSNGFIVWLRRLPGTTVRRWNFALLECRILRTTPDEASQLV